MAWLARDSFHEQASEEWRLICINCQGNMVKNMVEKIVAGVLGNLQWQRLFHLLLA